MEISIISKEIIKPSSISSICNKKPFKISLLDQLTPATYAPIILFFPSKLSTIPSTRLLKSSLSKTLTHLYPFSGRLKNNFSIHDFEQGVPYVETRVSCKMSDFLQQPQLDKLNHFVARRPYSHEFKIDTLPQLAVQVNIFDCGGMAISVSVFHKIFDGSTASFFWNSWAAAARGSNIHIDSHILEAASSLYPPMDLLPRFYEKFWDTLWFNKSNLKTGRFVFSEQAITTLRAEARSEHVEYPTGMMEDDEVKRELQRSKNKQRNGVVKEQKKKRENDDVLSDSLTGAIGNDIVESFDSPSSPCLNDSDQKQGKDNSEAVESEPRNVDRQPTSRARRSDWATRPPTRYQY